MLPRQLRLATRGENNLANSRTYAKQGEPTSMVRPACFCGSPWVDLGMLLRDEGQSVGGGGVYGGVGEG
jgi:hypothetical protein